MANENTEFEARPTWLDDDTERAMQAAITSGAPARSLALYARWWQLETWLRDLAYLEMRAAGGVKWESDASAATGRKNLDQSYSHMTGPDNENPLAYLDYSQLVKAIDDRWELFSRTLIEKKSWDGRQVELGQIRHRIGHVRRAHVDDLSRIEQTLRDLEGGAFLAVSQYNDRWQPPADVENPVSDGWLKGQHADAKRLLVHAERQYDTTLQIRRSFRPWSNGSESGRRTGQLWHADFYTGGRVVDIAKLWREIDGEPLSALLVHLSADSTGSTGFVFSAVDDENAIADSIGTAFEAVLSTSRSLDRSDWTRHSEMFKTIDFRVKIDTAWNIVDRSTLPISMFDSGGGLQTLPKPARRR